MPSPHDPAGSLRHSIAAGLVRAVGGEGAGGAGPTALEGLAIPYGVPYRLPWGETETIARGAFRESVAQWRGRKDARPAYLASHGGPPVAAITDLRDTTEGVRFRAELLRGADGELTGPARDYVTQVLAGITGASAEYMPAPDGTERTKDGYRVTRGSLLAVAGAHAPAYDSARVIARSVEGAMPGQLTAGDPGPVDFGARLVAMHADAVAEVRTLTGTATAEGRELTSAEDAQLRSAQDRVERLTRQTTAYTEERARITAERTAAGSAAAGHEVRVTRHEPVYRGEAGVSWFRDIVHAGAGDAMAAERMSRHRAFVADLASQLDRRAIASGDLAGAIPTQYAPELYVPDLAYTGPLFGFFARTPITNAQPIVVPTFASVTGDTGPQGTENTALADVKVVTAPKTITPVAVGGESIVSRQIIDGASPGADVMIGAELRELLMRDQERAIALVIEALTATGTLPDTAGTTPAQSGRDLERGLRVAVAKMLGARFLPAEGIFANATDYENLAAGEDLQGRPVMPMIGATNADSTFSPGFTGGVIAGVPVAQAWAILDPKNDFVARRNDARSWASTILDIRLDQRNGPQSIVFAVWQYFAFAVLQPKGVAKWTYTNVLAADALAEAERAERAERATGRKGKAADAES